MTRISSQKSDNAALLLADIGGTNARFGVRDGRGRIRFLMSVPTKEIKSLACTLKRLCEGSPQHLSGIALGAAGPVRNGRVTLTNAAVSIAAKDVAALTGIERVLLVNDLAAVGRAIPHVRKHELRSVVSGVPTPHAPKVIVAPGTGLGHAVLVPGKFRSWNAVAGEGGHCRFPISVLSEESALQGLHSLHPSTWEELLSGRGLVAIYRTKSRGRKDLVPEQITRWALEGNETACAAVWAFSYLLGSFTQQMVLVAGGRAGCFIGGGLVPGLGVLFKKEAFRRGFYAGQFERGYVAGIPVHLIITQLAAFRGLAALFDEVHS